jgi:hypothetical protein
MRASLFALVLIMSNQATFADRPLQEIMRQPGQIAPAEDPLNKFVASTAIFAMLVKLEIRGDIVVKTEVKLTSAPFSRSSFSGDESGIVVEVCNPDREPVGRASLADRKMFARDGETVIVTDRTVSAVIPVLGIPDTIIVNIPGVPSSHRVTITRQIRAQCRDSSLEHICSNPSPESSPYFEYLQASEQQFTSSCRE